MNATTLRKQLENILALPLTPVKVAELVKLGRLDGPTPAVHDVAADARAALLKESPEVVVEGFGMVKTNRASFGGLPVYCTFFSRERDGMPPLWRGQATSRLPASAASAHLWAVADLLDDAKL
jgi:hypothetical protein